MEAEAINAEPSVSPVPVGDPQPLVTKEKQPRKKKRTPAQMEQAKVDAEKRRAEKLAERERKKAEAERVALEKNVTKISQTRS